MTASAPIIELADALVEALNDASLGMEFEAERVYQVPDGSENASLAQNDTLRVLVVPLTVATESSARARVQDQIEIAVVVMQRVGDKSTEKQTTDDLVGFTAAVASYLQRLELDDTEARWVGGVVDPVYSPDWLNTKRTFASTITLTYLLTRAPGE